MRPLPRVLAFTDARVATHDDLGVRAAALAAAGPAVALVARLPGGSADALAALADRLARLVQPPGAQCFVTGRADVAASVGGHGVVLRRGDLAPADARAVAPLTVLRSVHDPAEAEEAAAEGADALVVGTIWPSATHPGRPGAGVELLARCAAFGVPVYAIGGVTPARAREAVAAGAWGVAAIRALWDAPKPYLAVLEMLDSVTQPDQPVASATGQGGGEG